MIENSAGKRALIADKGKVLYKDEVCTHLFFTTSAAAFHILHSRRKMDKEIQFAEDKTWLRIKNVAIY